jgi:WD40 repeat protein
VLNLHLPDGSVQRYTTFPATTVKLLFPEGNAILDRETAPDNWKPALSPPLKRMQFVKVSDSQRRFAITGVVYAHQLFTFDELFCDENPVVMSQLMRAAGIFPKNTDEALYLAKLYLSLTYYRLQDPIQFVVSSADELPKEKVSFPGESEDDIRGVLHPPRIVSAGSEYRSELFARDLDMLRIHRWRMTISPAGLQDVSDQRVYPNYKEMLGLYSRVKKGPTPGGEDKIELWRCCFMGNGRTEDGAMTDLQLLAASNGPFVSRTHYYYETEEKAEQLMQRYMSEAVAVVESGAWLDSDMKQAGSRSTIITARRDQTLSAVVLFKKDADASVLEFSSLCLRNLLALGISPPKGKGASDSLVAKLDCPDRVNAVAFSPDGKQLAAGYGWNVEGGVRVWTVAGQNIVHSWVSTRASDSNDEAPDSNDMIMRMAFSPDGKLLAAATWDGDLLFFDTNTWGQPRKVIRRAGSPSGLSFSPKGDLLAFSTDKSVILYEPKSGKVKTIKTQQGITQRFIAGGFLPDGKTLVICDSRTLQFWDTAAEKSTKSVDLSGPNFFCHVSQLGYYVVAGGGAVYGKKLVEVWRVRDTEPPAQISGFHSGLFAIAISHSQDIMAFGGGDYGGGSDLVLWKIGETQESGHVSTGKFPIEALDFSADDALLAAASHDGAVFLYAVGRIRSVPTAPPVR